MIRPTYAVFEHQLVAYRRTWRGSVLSSFLLPVLFLLAMGFTVGGYVDRAGGLSVRYVDFIAPGLLASTALQIAVGESTWPVYSGFKWHRMYHAMQATPVRVTDMVRGHIGYVLLRVGLSAAGFLVVMGLFGTLHSAWAPAALPVAVLVGLATAAPVFAYSASISTEGLFAVLLRVAVIPMTLFAGVFFPVGSLPLWARILAYVSPLWHGVELSRAATLGTATAWGVWAHLGYLAVWSVVGYLLATHRFRRRLAD
ncbi:ABC transporter permease [Planosporangium thailandense]|uniref:Transport permease protein n=1 Tax=Planosporangium thailandense TaxID=765197 RepID=A0ABX0Y0U8_9ACTN|nr:ABC transporter permease [Planosporangium thailandense]NJC71048.1 ABC transporter permease [Planosporangium thailandense]